MKIHIFFLGAFFLLVNAINATENHFFTGTFRIIPAASTELSLSVRNSSLSNQVPVYVWTETNVNAQHWYISDSTTYGYHLRNAYTNMVVQPKEKLLYDGNKIEQGILEGADTDRWKLIPVPADIYTNAYYICNAASCIDGDTLCLSLDADAENGMFPELKTLTHNDIKQFWSIQMVDSVPNTFTASMRDELMAAFKQHYYQKADVGYMLGGPERWNDGSYWWQSASMMEVILDAYETTGDSQYRDMYQQLYTNFINKNGENWLYNKFNDDITWMIISCVRAYLLFGTEKYLTLAQNNFSAMYDRAYLTECGLLRWLEDNPDGDMTNSCINGPAEVAACYLAQATGDNSYYDKARELYLNQRDRLFEPSTGRVYDCVLCGGSGSPWNWASTYNQGTYLGAAVMLYNHYGDDFYKKDARKMMQYVVHNLCDSNGIVNVCGTGRDKIGFKGILMRYVRRFITDMHEPGYIGWLQKNIIQGWNNRNSLGIIWTAWWNKTSDDLKAYDDAGEMTDDFSGDAFGPSTAISLAFNTPLNEKSVTKNAYSRIEAEDFNYIKAVYVTHDSNSEDETQNLISIRNGAWVAYYNVDFGTKVASRVKFRYASLYTGGKIEIHLGNPQGVIIGSFDINSTTGWNDYQTGSCSTQNVTGLQNIYLVFTGSGNILNLNYFSFETDEPCNAPTIISNAGVLSSSHEAIAQHTLANVADGIANSYYSTGITSNDNFWICYRSPVPVKLMSYSFSGFSSGLEPQNWVLQVSNNGTDWVNIDLRSEQSVMKNVINKYDVYSDQYYEFFRLNVDKFKSQDQQDSLFLNEWCLSGTALPQQDITDSTGVISTACGPGNKIIDNQISTCFSIPQTEFSVQYTSSREYTPLFYTLTSGNDPAKSPKNWILYASKDGKIWEIADRRENQCFDAGLQTGVYGFDLKDSFRYFKLNVSDNNGNVYETEISEWQLFGRVGEDVTFYNDITSGTGVISSSVIQDNVELVKLIDNDGKSIFRMPLSEINWIQYETKYPTRLWGYSLMVGDNKKNNPSTWMLKASNDGVRWTTISTCKNIVFQNTYQKNQYNITNSGRYTYFRLVIDSINDKNTGSIEIAELELNGNSVVANTVMSELNGTVSAQFESPVATENYQNLIDNNSTTKYLLGGRHHFWIEYEVPEPIKLKLYSLTSANDYPERDPAAWNLYASKDGEHWSCIDSVVSNLFIYRYETQYFPCKPEDTYRFFMLEVLESNASEMTQLAEWQLFNEELVSALVTPERNNAYITNFPNPFKYQTTVSCTVPDGINMVQMNIYSSTGVLIDSNTYQVKPGTNQFVWTNSKKISGLFLYNISMFSQGRIVQQQKQKFLIIK